MLSLENLTLALLKPSMLWPCRHAKLILEHCFYLRLEKIVCFLMIWYVALKSRYQFFSSDDPSIRLSSIDLSFIKDI